MDRTKFALSIIIVLLFGLMAAYYFLVPRHAASTSLTGNYQIDEPFDRVRKNPREK